MPRRKFSRDSLCRPTRCSAAPSSMSVLASFRRAGEPVRTVAARSGMPDLRVHLQPGRPPAGSAICGGRGPGYRAARPSNQFGATAPVDALIKHRLGFVQVALLHQGVRQVSRNNRRTYPLGRSGDRPHRITKVRLSLGKRTLRQPSDTTETLRRRQREHRTTPVCHSNPRVQQRNHFVQVGSDQRKAAVNWQEVGLLDKAAVA